MLANVYVEVPVSRFVATGASRKDCTAVKTVSVATRNYGLGSEVRSST
jgi:hypothetical protein